MSSNQAIHPARERLAAYGLGKLQAAEAVAVESHIAECEECCETLLDLGSDTFVELVGRSDAVQLDSVDEETIGLRRTNTATVSELPEELVQHPRYRVLELLGKGGMGNVYKAEHTLMNRSVALKVINRQLVQNGQAAERFRREVQSAAQLAHPNIVTAHDAEQAGDMHFLVMEYVPGDTLSDVVKRDAPLDISLACDYIQQAAQGLQHAHEKGMVHRDIKPHNLMVTSDGQIKILDFGLATLTVETTSSEDNSQTSHASTDHRIPSNLTSAGSMMGTPDFVSPEQSRDARAADIRSDIYSLGCTFYYLLTGRPPFSEGSALERIKAHSEQEAESIENVRDDVPPELAEILRRMMTKAPAQRFQTPAEIADALAPFVDAHRTTPAQDRVPETANVGHRSWWPPTILQSVALAAVAFVLAGMIYITTDNGTLKIDAADDSVEVIIRSVNSSKQGQEAISEMRIVDTVTGTSAKRLPSGEYVLSLKGDKNDFEIDKERFVLKRGDKIIVTVTRKTDNELTLIEPGGSEKVTTDSVVSRRVASDIDIDYAGKPSSDGRLLPYVDFGGGKILVRDFSDNSDRQIAEWTWSASRSEYVFCDGVPVLSPDGDRIAYTWFREGVWELRTTALDGSDTRVIYRNEADVDRVEPHDWSPNGEYILASFIKKNVEGEPALGRGIRNIALVSVADGEAKTMLRRWGNVGGMRFSPDGQYIAYHRSTKGRQRDIYVLPISGSEPIPVVEHPKDDALIGWAPSGDKLLFTSNRLGNRDVWSVDFKAGATKGSPAIVKTGFGDVRWLGITPGGEVFYATSARMLLDVYTVAFDSKTGNADSAPEKISLVREGASTSPDWSRDGKQLAYVTAGRRGPSAVVIHSLESGEYAERTLELGSIRGKGARWSPDSGSLVLAGFDKEGRGIYRVDAQTGEVTVVKRGYISQPEWTPDGESIIFCRANPDDVLKSGHTEIIKRGVESGEEHRLLEFQGAGLNSSFALSPDGSQLAFMVHEEGTVALNVASVSNGQPRELHRVEKPAWMGRVDWAPDGSFVLFEHRPSEDSTELWRVPAQGGTAEKIPLSTDGINLAGYIYPRIHPDGQRIAFTAITKGALSEVRVIDNLFDHADGQDRSSR